LKTPIERTFPVILLSAIVTPSTTTPRPLLTPSQAQPTTFSIASQQDVKKGKTLPAARKQISNEAGHLFYFDDALGEKRKTSRKSNVPPLHPTSSPFPPTFPMPSSASSFLCIVVIASKTKTPIHT